MTRYILSGTFYSRNESRYSLNDATPEISLLSVGCIIMSKSLFNVFLLTGKKSNLLVFDLDMSGMNRSKFDALINWLVSFPIFSKVGIQKSKSLGVHICGPYNKRWSKCDTKLIEFSFDVREFCIKGELDIRSNVGGIVAQPSAAYSSKLNMIGTYDWVQMPSYDSTDSSVMVKIWDFMCKHGKIIKRLKKTDTMKRKIDGSRSSKLKRQRRGNAWKMIPIQNEMQRKEFDSIAKDYLMDDVKCAGVSPNDPRYNTIYYCAPKNRDQGRFCPIVPGLKHDCGSGGQKAYFHRANDGSDKILYRCFAGKCKDIICKHGPFNLIPFES